MKILCFLSIVIILITSCGDPDNFPKSYTLDRVEQSDEGLYKVEDATHLSELPVTSGSYGAYRTEFKSDIRELMEIAFDLVEIELQDENSLFFQYEVDNVVYDTTLSYSNVNGEIVIDGLTGSLLSFEKEDDQFVVCGVATFALAGPNASDPDLPYGQFDVIECTAGFSNVDYANEMLSQFDFGVQDTIGVLKTRYIYK